MTEMTSQDLVQLLDGIAAVMTREKARLCELDGTIGDGDHGIAMELGFQAAAKAAAALDPGTTDPTAILNAAAKAFLNAVGASSGPLYATGLMRAAAAVKGKAVPGEKTMVDAWAPAAAALSLARQTSEPLRAAFRLAREAAEAGALSTREMVATKGRSARLGERSLGHIDPGAASAALVIVCFADFFLRR